LHQRVPEPSRIGRAIDLFLPSKNTLEKHLVVSIAEVSYLFGASETL
jgi:hypothetical protein